MADTFISYSRKDIAFAKIVHESLESSDLETWIDWQDIPPSADWFAEIEEAIEKADTFIFIISLTSVESEVCNREIAHAEKNNKRLIPVVIDDIDPQRVPNTLLPLNWIFFKEEDQEYAQALENLITAITLDQPWVKKHTRFQNRALEWERSEYKSGYLLHGADLEDAEAWLSQAAGKDPAPTALQTRYIVASRTAATRQQRRTLIGVAAALVVALALGVLAWTQRNAAVRAEATAVAEANSRATQQAIAEEQTIAAQSRELAALSGNLLEEELDLGILLAIESFNKSESYITRGSVMQSLQTSPQVSRMFHVNSGGDDDEITTLEFSPNGRMLAYGHNNGTIHFLDPGNGEELLPAITTVDGGQVYDFAFNPDGSLLVSAAGNGLQIWRVSDREEIFRLSENEKYYLAAFSPDGNLAAGLRRTGPQKLFVWNSQTGEMAWSSRQLSVRASSELVFTPNGDYIIVYSKPRGIDIFESRTGEHVVQSLNMDPSEYGTGTFGMHPEGHILVQVDGDNTIYLYDLDKGRLVSQVVSTQGSEIFEVIFSNTGQYFFTISRTDVFAWDGNTGEAVGSVFAMDNSFNDVAMEPAGSFLAAGDDYGRIYLLNLYSSGEPFPSMEDTSVAIDFVNNSTIYVLQLNPRLIQYFDLETGEEISQPVEIEEDLIGGQVLSPDGKLLATSDNDGRIYLLDAATGEEIVGPLLGHDIEQVDVPRWDIVVEDIETDTVAGLYGTFDLNLVRGLAFSPDSTMLASAGNDMTVRLWDVASGTQIGEPLRGHTNILETVAFSEDGRLLASGGENGRIIIWDTESREMVGEPIERPGRPVHDIVFSRDGETLITAWSDGAIILWDTDTHLQIGLPNLYKSGRYLHIDIPQVDPLQGCDAHRTHVVDLSLSPDGTRLASLDNDGSFRLWELDVDIWLERACTRAGRNMTQEEWELYLPYEPYRKTCLGYP